MHDISDQPELMLTVFTKNKRIQAPDTPWRPAINAIRVLFLIQTFYLWAKIDSFCIF